MPLDEPTIKRAVRHIAAFRRPGQRLLDVCYGPQSKPLRTQVAALLLDRKVTGSDKVAQWGNFRLLMLNALAVPTGVTCIAAEDQEFQRRADELL